MSHQIFTIQVIYVPHDDNKMNIEDLSNVCKSTSYLRALISHIHRHIQHFLRVRNPFLKFRSPTTKTTKIFLNFENFSNKN